MAVYSDDLPDGVDIMFNTNKGKNKAKMECLKPIKSDPDNPFGALIKAGGQSYYIDDEMVVFPVKWDETTETYQRINEKGVTLYTLSQDDNFKFLVLNTLDAGSDFNEFSLVEDPFDNTDALFLMKFSYGDLIG